MTVGLRPLVGLLALALIGSTACSNGTSHATAHPTSSSTPSARSTTTVQTKRRSPVSAQIVLPMTTLRAGSSLNGHVVLQNNTGHVLHASGCLRYFQVALANAHYRPQPAWLPCLQRFTFPVGVSRYPVTVDASHLSCTSGPPVGDVPICITRDGHPVPPPLPTGVYNAKLFQSGNLAPTPPAVTVRVTR